MSAPTDGRVRLVHVTTVPMTLGFLRGQVEFMGERGFEVVAVSSPGEALDRFGAEQGVPVHGLAMERKISPLADLRALFRMIRLLRRLDPDIVHSHTPKAGLLGTLAAFLARVPVRVYHLRGSPMVTARGLTRAILKAVDRLTCGLAHRVICVSHSHRALMVEEGVVEAEKAVVLAGGSSNGVDARGRFDPDRQGEAARSALRAELGIPTAATVIGFVGRLVRDKGIVELAQAWQSLREEHPEAQLVLVGDLEQRDAVPDSVMRGLIEDPRVHRTGFVADAAPFYAAMDLLVLPTYREGFPNVPLEAAAMELPAVVTQMTGCVDAVEDGVTGTIVPVRDADALARAIAAYLEEPELRARHGRAGRKRVLETFDPRGIWRALWRTYLDLLEARRAGRRGA